MHQYLFFVGDFPIRAYGLISVFIVVSLVLWALDCGMYFSLIGHIIVII